jgi:hypothetical protein
MNRIALPIFFLLTLAGLANADQFQFQYRRGNETYYPSYSNVRVYNANRNEVFNGYLDKFGRVSINLPNGSYDCSVYYRGKLRNTQLDFSGTTKLRIIELQKE